MDAIVRILSENAKTEIATVDTALYKLENAVITARGNAKEQAIACLELYQAMKSCDKMKGLKFPKFIDARFHGEIKGVSAYAFAQTALLFKDNSDVWDFFSLSAMSELKALYEKDKNSATGYAYKKDVSFDDFCHWSGMKLDEMTETEYQNWLTNNRNALEQIEALKNAGVYSEGAINIEPEPTKSLARQYAEENDKVAPVGDIGEEERKRAFAENDKWYIDSVREMGFGFLVNLTTKDLRKAVETYLESKGQAKKEIKSKKPTAPTDPATAPTDPATAPTAPTDPEPPTPEELKAIALNALVAYLETVEGSKPATLTKAVKYLEGGAK